MPAVLPAARAVAPRIRSRLAALWLGLLALAAAVPAGAVPRFAMQTGEPCQTCHVGGFGPQLTPFGRQFKLGGYTQTAGKWTVPLSVMAVASYLGTSKDQPPQPHYRPNDNTTLDQASLFVAGGFGDHLGGFVQVTYDGVARAWTWDQLDLRAVTKTEAGGQDLLLGLSLNNNPTVQDPWNTLPAWGYPYTDSGLAPGPAAAPLLNGALAQDTLGLTAYAWLNSKLYLELGGYQSPGATNLRRLGADPTSPGDIKGIAPYARAAVQQPLGAGTAEVGLVALRAELHPGRDRTTGTTDRYTDWGLDGSYFLTRPNGDVVTLNARALREDEHLAASCLLAELAADCSNSRLTDLRADVAYYWKDKYGLTLGAFDTFGPANPLLYPDSRTFKPDSAGVMAQLDTTLYGRGSPLGPRFNVRVGLQFIHYTEFDGARRNYDGAGANASDNDSLRVFTWFAF
jgi:hypothetical protein